MRRGVRQAGIAAAGFDQLLQRVLLVDRHQHVAQIVVGGVQRDGQHDADLLAGAHDLRHDAGGRQRDAALRQRQAVAVRRDQQRLLDRLEIVERLAHAHHDDVGDLAALGGHDGAGRRVAIGEVAEPVARRHQLRRGFPRRSGCAPASACRCGRRSRSACSRPGWRCRACRDPPRGCRRSRSRQVARRRAAETGTATCGCRRSEICSSTISGRAIEKCFASSPRRSLEMLNISPKSETPRT